MTSVQDACLLSDAFKMIEATTGSASIAAFELNSALREGRIHSKLRIIDASGHTDRWVDIASNAWDEIRILPPMSGRTNPGFRPGYPFASYGNCFVYLLRSEVTTAWPAFQQPKMAASDAQSSKRKGRGGRGGDFDWERCLIEAARWMHHEGVPAKQADLVRYIAEWFGEDCPSDTQLKEHLGPLYLAIKTGQSAD